MKLTHQISQYPEDYSLEVELQKFVASFTCEASGQPVTTYELSLEELINAGELAKKFKEMLCAQ